MNKRFIVSGLCFMLILSIFIPISFGFNVRIINIEGSAQILNRRTLFVGGNGPNNYTFIQNAIDNADEGDTIFVFNYSSPYYEKLVINKSINLVGVHKNSTIIDGKKMIHYTLLRFFLMMLQSVI